MRMWNRSVNSSEYKYGFNGKEKDDEVKGEGNSYDYGERIYDPRIGRWISPDKFEAFAPMWTPYRFGLNNPIKYSDSEGNFEIDENTAAAYPKLKPALKNLLETLQKPENLELVDQLVKLGEFESPEKLFEVLTDGKGPKLSVADIVDYNTETKLKTDGSDDIITFYSAELTSEGEAFGLDGVAAAFTQTKYGTIKDGIVKVESQEVVLDDAVANLSNKVIKNNDRVNQFFARILNNIIIHEIAHVGDQRDGKRNSAEGAGDEVGEAAEKVNQGEVSDNIIILSKNEPKKKG